MTSYSNDIKGLIVDLDSFPQEMDELWSQVDRRTRLLFFSAVNEERLHSVGDQDERFSICRETPFDLFITKRRVLLEQLRILDIPSNKAGFLSGTSITLEEFTISRLPQFVIWTKSKQITTRMEDVCRIFCLLNL